MSSPSAAEGVGNEFENVLVGDARLDNGHLAAQRLFAEFDDVGARVFLQ
jgi:hypothetical protein